MVQESRGDPMRFLLQLLMLVTLVACYKLAHVMAVVVVENYGILGISLVIVCRAAVIMEQRPLRNDLDQGLSLCGGDYKQMWLATIRRVEVIDGEISATFSNPSCASGRLSSLNRLARKHGVPLRQSYNQSDNNGLSRARTSSSTLAGALHMKRDPRCSHEALRNWSVWTTPLISSPSGNAT